MQLRRLTATIDWIKSDGPRGPWIRVSLVAIVALAWGAWRSWREGGVNLDAWAWPIIWIVFLVVPSILWWLMQRARHAERRRRRAPRGINLEA